MNGKEVLPKMPDAEEMASDKAELQAQAEAKLDEYIQSLLNKAADKMEVIIDVLIESNAEEVAKGALLVAIALTPPGLRRTKFIAVHMFIMHKQTAGGNHASNKLAPYMQTDPQEQQAARKMLEETMQAQEEASHAKTH